jgi:hypothetical protein
MRELMQVRSEKYKYLKMVEAGQSEYSGVLKTRKLLIFRHAKNAEPDKIAPSWNVSGTRNLAAQQFKVLEIARVRAGTGAAPAAGGSLPAASRLRPSGQRADSCIGCDFMGS